MKTSNAEMNPLYEVVPDDAIGMLIADHKRVANLFADYKRLNEEDRGKEKAAVVAEICQELTIHTQLEEEIFYPAVREAIDDDDQMDEALVEHAGAKELIAQLQAATPDDELYDAKVTVLREQIDHHVDEEEGSMFPKARHAGLDTLHLGAAMLARKSELLGGAPGRAPPPKATDAADEGDDAEGDGAEGDDAGKSPRKPRPAAKKKSSKKKPGKTKS